MTEERLAEIEDCACGCDTEAWLLELVAEVRRLRLESVRLFDRLRELHHD